MRYAQGNCKRKMAVKIHVMGSNGKLGTQVVAAINKDHDFCISESLEKADVVIDVSSHLACADHIEQALASKKPLVIGTTGHSSHNYSLMEKAALLIPLLVAPNFSLAMASFFEVASLLAQKLGKCSIEIIEAHHAHKKDLPSGTALALAKTLGSDNPPPIHSIRDGEIMGEHTVIFLCEGERIELKHQVLSREIFAKGALKAAQFLSHQNPGLYSIKDVVYAAC